MGTLEEQKRQHEIEFALSRIAFVLAITRNWDADTLEGIADIVGEVTAHPGDVESAESYTDKLGQDGLPVSYGMLIEAQEADGELDDE
jgi:hypothetical protein